MATPPTWSASRRGRRCGRQHGDDVDAGQGEGARDVDALAARLVVTD